MEIKKKDMASELDVASDDISDSPSRQVPAYLLDYLKTRISNYVTRTDDVSAEIERAPGQRPRLVFSLGIKSGMSFY